MDQPVRIAIYMRLSREDEGTGQESNSIRMQRMLLTEYVRQHFEEYRLQEFSDDGYSGTNFNRPGVRRLLDLAASGGLDCILVKDFSRFSRDYIGLGDHLERFFPAWGVRFISVNDHYDSDVRKGAGDMDTAFRGLLYDFYSRDLSVKVKSSLNTRKRKGQYAGANCPFGYKKDPQDRHRLVVEEDEAAVVRRIFSLAGEGAGCGQIARLLNREGVRTPAEFGIAKGRIRREPKGKKFSWASSVISRILKNRAYVGDMVYGKTQTAEAGGKNLPRPEQEWGIFPNHHEAVVSSELFERVQREGGRKERRRQTPSHPLTGKLVCGGCGKNLRFRRGLNPYFTCPGLYTDPQEGCVSRLNAMFAEQRILFELQRRTGMDVEACLTEECVEEWIHRVLVRGEGLEICWREEV